jgi:peptidoglycan hydrolase CwlO-like protein
MFITSSIRVVQSMAEGTRVQELQQQMESAKGMWEIFQSQQAQMQSQQSQMQNQINQTQQTLIQHGKEMNQHGVDIKDLSSKMDQLLEVMLARNSVPGMETPAFVQQGPLEGRHTREMEESSFGFCKSY